jgi:cytosine/adenosine deaminase-related metal-dependent hydrolase
MILRSRLLYPVAGKPIENGAIALAGDRIRALSTWPEMTRLPGEPVVDLGEMVILPGLINGHCHLDYTAAAGLIAAPRKFTDWVQTLSNFKTHYSVADYQAAWQSGAAMLLRNGATTVGDHEAIPDLLPAMWSRTPLRVHSLLEMTGVKSRRPPQEILDEASAQIDRLPAGRQRAGLAPHALYSTTPELLRRAAALAAERRWLVSMHLAESADERDMFEHRDGALFEWLKVQRDVSDCSGKTPVACAHEAGLIRANFLAVHANYVTEDDAQLLGANGASVAHCPRSHAYFGHGPFPYERFRRAGVNVCLGTDSLASVKKEERLELDLFVEMRQFARVFPQISPGQVLEMATVNGARALGMKSVGALVAGHEADLIAIPGSGSSSGLAEELIQHTGPVHASIIAGQWALKPAGIDL